MSHDYDLVIVGLGSGGIVAAEFATRLGLRVAAVERARVGGDCLWTGCVPSKALIASARTAHAMRTAARLGLPGHEPDIDLAAVWQRMQDVRERIAASDDDPARFRAMGVDLVEGEARLAGRHAVEAAGRTLDTRFTLVCTGSRPAVPPVDGLERAGYLTSESLFDVDRPPRSLAVVGGGPIGVEMAQACRRLGIDVTLLERGDRLLARDEPGLVETLTATLRGEGVDVRHRARIDAVASNGERKSVQLAGDDVPIVAEDILVAAGRKANIEALGLEEIGVEVGDRGIEVDAQLRTNVRSIYAAGDAAGRFLFTHSAGHEAAQAVRNMFFPGRAKAVELVPWCTFSDPELAHVGLTEGEARQRHGDRKVAAHELTLEHSDRARADAADDGALVIVTAGGRIVGAHALAPAAGELIHALVAAVDRGAKLRDLSGIVHVYPTLSTSIAMLAAEASYQRARGLSWLVHRR